MRKSSRKELSIARSSLISEDISKKSIFEEASLLKPEERFYDEALADLYYRSLITLSLGKNFSERTEINKKEVERFTLLYNTDPGNVKFNAYTGIIPLKKKGHKWESKPSKAIRKKYRTNADKMFERLRVCDFGSENVNSGVIELVDIPYKTVDHLEFSSAAALVDKKPHKRLNHNSGDAVYFKDFYLNGKRAMLFGVFDALSAEKDSDNKTVIALMSLFKKFFNSVVFIDDTNVIFSFFTEFLNHAEKTLPSNKNFSGVSMIIGLVHSGYLYYLNIGDCRAYIASFHPELYVKKITLDDGMAGLVERGASITKKEFFSQLKSPELFLGSFSQSLSKNKRKRIIHKKIVPVPPNIGKITLRDAHFLLVSTDGFWSNLPIIAENDFIIDASGEKTIESILSDSDLKNPKQILESLYNYSKSNMKLKRTNTKDDAVIKPNPQDIGLLGFSL